MLYEQGDEEFLPQATINEVVELLKTNQLTVLSLTSTGLDSKYAKELAEGLSENKSLRFLNLSYNPYISDGGVYHLLKALEKHPSLTVLRLDDTGCSGDIAYYLKDFIKNNTNLRFLSFREADFAHESIEVVAEAIKDNKTLLGLNLPIEVLREEPPFYAVMDWRHKAISVNRVILDSVNSNGTLCAMNTRGLEMVTSITISNKLDKSMASTQAAETLPPELLLYMETMVQDSSYDILKKLDENSRKLNSDKNTSIQSPLSEESPKEVEPIPLINIKRPSPARR